MAVRLRLDPLRPSAAPPIVLDRPLLLVGSDPGCDVRVAHPSVSGRHCCIAAGRDEGASLVLRDLGSAWGTTVNGRWVDEVRLLPGDAIRIGALEYLVRCDAEGPVVADA